MPRRNPGTATAMTTKTRKILKRKKRIPLVLRIFFKILVILGDFCGEIGILAIGVNDFKFCVDLGLRISNFANLSISQNFKFSQILFKKFLSSQIFAGFRFLWRFPSHHSFSEVPLRRNHFHARSPGLKLIIQIYLFCKLFQKLFFEFFDFDKYITIK